MRIPLREKGINNKTSLTFNIDTSVLIQIVITKAACRRNSVIFIFSGCVNTASYLMPIGLVRVYSLKLEY